MFSTLPGTSLGCGRFSRSEAGPWDLYVSQTPQMIVVMRQFGATVIGDNGLKHMSVRLYKNTDDTY